MTQDSKPERDFRQAIMNTIKNADTLFVPQMVFGPYKADMGCPSKKVAIEVMGWEWHCGKVQFEKDIARTRYFQMRGWTVIPYAAKEIMVDLDGCVDNLTELLNLEKIESVSIETTNEQIIKKMYQSGELTAAQEINERNDTNVISVFGEITRANPGGDLFFMDLKDINGDKIALMICDGNIKKFKGVYGVGDRIWAKGKLYPGNSGVYVKPFDVMSEVAYCNSVKQL